MAQLEQVAEQYEAVDIRERAAERLERLGPPEDVNRAPRADVGVGDDKCSHRRAG